jgi:hypothetical protein
LVISVSLEVSCADATAAQSSMETEANIVPTKMDVDRLGFHLVLPYWLLIALHE